MAFNLEFDTSAYKDGPVIHTTVPNFPTNVSEAIATFGEDVVLAGFVKSYVIAEQAKIRAKYKAPSTTRTKRGSALAQIEAARRAETLKQVSENAAAEVSE